ncbi:MAG: PEGA domain-containing protein [Spirochaetaceae bacterium]|nr:MAG: PEGA domain-containing protein [Spirochaetaceae bacterium]
MRYTRSVGGGRLSGVQRYAHGVRFATLICAVAIVASLGSCAIVAGSTLETVIDAESARRPVSGDADASPVRADEPRLRVITRPDDARVSIDNRYVGRTPLDIDDIAPGRYWLYVEKEGFVQIERRITIEERGSLVIELELEQITGFLQVDTDRAATITVGSRRLDDGFAELPIGIHTVRVERFGYQPQIHRVVVDTDRLTRLSIDLEPAPFAVDGFAASRRAFNPDNPGLTGTVTVRFRVTAPGDGTLLIRSQSGELLRSIAVGPFAEWDQSVLWDGTDSGGRRVPDGEYQAELEAIGGSGQSQIRRTAVRVDRSLIVRYRSIWGGYAGLLYAPTLDPLPPGQVQLSGQIAGAALPTAEGWVGRFPARIGARIGVARSVELVVHGGAILHVAPGSERWSAGAAATWAPRQARGATAASVAAGLVGGALYQSPIGGSYAGPDSQASHLGFFAGVPVSLRLASVTATISPEVRLSPAPVWYGGSPRPDEAWVGFGYLRYGIAVDIGAVTAGVSGALRTTPFSGPFGVEAPYLAGAEAHVVLPGLPVVVSLIAAAEIESSRNFYAMGGFGVGLLF